MAEGEIITLEGSQGLIQGDISVFRVKTVGDLSALTSQIQKLLNPTGNIMQDLHTGLPAIMDAMHTNPARLDNQPIQVQHTEIHDGLFDSIETNIGIIPEKVKIMPRFKIQTICNCAPTTLEKPDNMFITFEESLQISRRLGNLLPSNQKYRLFNPRGDLDGTCLSIFKDYGDKPSDQYPFRVAFGRMYDDAQRWREDTTYNKIRFESIFLHYFYKGRIPENFETIVANFMAEYTRVLEAVIKSIYAVKGPQSARDALTHIAKT